jgi:hypothetical protein
VLLDLYSLWRGSGANTYTSNLVATEVTSAARTLQVNIIRAGGQAESPLLVNGIATTRSASQASASVLVKLAELVRSASQASAATLLKLIARGLALVQGSFASLAKLVEIARQIAQS